MYNVLLVDDEPWVILGLRKLIDWQTEGFEIIGEATNGIAAYDMIQKYLPNVVITDIRMPGMKGLDLIRKVKELSLETEFIIISGYSEFSYAQEAVKLGAFDYLLKEVDEKILLDSLRRIKLKIRKREKEGSVPLDSIFLETMFNLIERGESEQAIRQLLEARGLDCAHPCFCVVNIVLSDDSSLINGVEEIFEYNYLKIRVGKNKYTFLLNIQDDQLGFLKNPLINSGSKDILAGISSMQDCCISYNRLYYEADVALNGFFTDPVSSVHMYKKQEISKFLKENQNSSILNILTK